MQKSPETGEKQPRRDKRVILQLLMKQQLQLNELLKLKKERKAYAQEEAKARATSMIMRGALHVQRLRHVDVGNSRVRQNLV